MLLIECQLDAVDVTIALGDDDLSLVIGQHLSDTHPDFESSGITHARGDGLLVGSPDAINAIQGMAFNEFAPQALEPDQRYSRQFSSLRALVETINSVEEWYHDMKSTICKWYSASKKFLRCCIRSSTQRQQLKTP